LRFSSSRHRLHRQSFRAIVKNHLAAVSAAWVRFALVTALLYLRFFCLL
jgi:hypothetical protein